MKFLKENIPELFLAIGIILISVGFFIYSTALGFIVTGLLFLGLTYLIWKKGGD